MARPRAAGAAGEGPRELVIRAPAKLNLFLEILGRRPDGYHELRSVLQALDWSDTVVLRRLPGRAATSPGGRRVARAGGASSRAQSAPMAQQDVVVTPWGGSRHNMQGSSAAGRSALPLRDAPRVRLRCTGVPVPCDATNLVHRAATALLRAAQSRVSVSIELHKRIPPGSGLGGGSSDAAATLWGLDRLLGLDFSSARLLRLAAFLGADVPFFLGRSGLALATGRGERVRALDPAPPVPYLVLVPPQRLATADVYQDLRERRGRLTGRRVPLSVFLRHLRSRRIERIRQSLHNHLEQSAVRLQDQVGTLLRRLRSRGFPFQLTGSGSAIFLPCTSWGEAQAVEAALSPLWRGWAHLAWSLAGRPVGVERRGSGGDHGGARQAP